MARGRGVRTGDPGAGISPHRPDRQQDGGEGMKRDQHLLMVVLAAAALIGVTSLFGNDYYLRIVFMMCVYYLCAAGMNVLVGYAGQKSLGQAGLFAAGAYAVALLTTRTDMN